MLSGTHSPLFSSVRRRDRLCLSLPPRSPRLFREHLLLGGNASPSAPIPWLWCCSGKEGRSPSAPSKGQWWHCWAFRVCFLDCLGTPLCQSCPCEASFGCSGDSSKGLRPLEHWPEDLCISPQGIQLWISVAICAHGFPPVSYTCL